MKHWQIFHSGPFRGSEFTRLKYAEKNKTTLHYFEHKAISPKSATLNIYKVCFLDGKNHFSP